jgi:hypothetical protein
LIIPKVIGALDESAAPAVPPTYFESCVVALSSPALLLSDDALDLEVLEPELVPESLPPHAATANAANTHAAAAAKPRIGLLLMTLSSSLSTLPRGDTGIATLGPGVILKHEVHPMQVLGTNFALG